MHTTHELAFIYILFSAITKSKNNNKILNFTLHFRVYKYNYMSLVQV